MPSSFQNLFVVAQADSSDPTMIVVVIAALVVLGLIVFFATRGSKPDAPKAAPPKGDEDVEKPTKNLLEDRMEVDAPVEIHDGMSLAEIKRAKAARVKSKDSAKRETAVDATEKAKADHGVEGATDDSDESSKEAEPVDLGSEEGDAAEADEAADAPEESADEKVEAAEAAPEKKELPKPKLPSLSGLPAPSEASEVSEATDDADEVEADDSKPKLPKPKLKLKKPASLDPSSEAEAEADDASDSAEPAEAKAEEEIEPEAPESAPEPKPEDAPEKETTLEQGLAKTRSGFIAKLSGLFQKEELDPDIVDEVEEVLFTADIGPGAAQKIMDALEEELGKDEKQDPSAVWRFVRGFVEESLQRREEKLALEAHSPFVMLVIGVNGVGKTTTIGKMASKFRRQGKSVLMVAGDTFRAAAVEQLEVWGERAGIEVYKGKDEQDPASVVYEGIEKAVKEEIDIVICDTAGRLQTNTNLLDELAKIGRVAGKVVDAAPHETILVLDANTGQNAIQQAKLFNDAVDITGIVLTKLDGTAKGGVILGICDQIDAPIRYIGIGEGVADLREFSATEFVEALFM